MRFVLYSEKNITQCFQAINERLQASGKFEGWIDKPNSRFVLSTSTKILRRFSRRTNLEADMTRDDGFTIIQGYVPHGVTLQGQLIIFGAAVLLGLLFFAGGNAILAIAAVLIGAWSYIPLQGDYNNSDTLYGEIKRTLKARETKPKKEALEPKKAISAPQRPLNPAARSTATMRPAAKPSPLGSARTAAPTAKPSPGANRPGTKK